jgi:hypothetical protein
MPFSIDGWPLTSCGLVLPGLNGRFCDLLSATYESYAGRFVRNHAPVIRLAPATTLEILDARRPGASTMSARRSPTFQIHRLDTAADSSDRHYRAFWRINGETFRVHVWNLDQWRRIPVGEQPRDACPLDGGVMVVRPIAGMQTQVK